MPKNQPPSPANQIDQFLQQVKNTPPVPKGCGRGRLIFAMDATASRQPTWDRACQLQGDMFTRTRGLGTLDVQLCFYRGYDEFRVSRWHREASGLLRAMSAVQCLGGHTQIGRVLRHVRREHQKEAVNALVFIGDCLEEPIDALCQLAGELGLLGVPLFLFQEGDDSTAEQGFKQMARLSRGAHCRFDSSSPAQLAALLNAVATYATGGLAALSAIRGEAPLIAQVRQQLEAPKS
ncbi:VWA domain-containing protein [Motiliproteus sp. SC1-56]|uniref:VWA domain-containing protein n=1 Tax=Motiliproteus sp. SC1-56 TaxID=2799565 RepID=UPI001A8DC7ED|nr:VWA domain-containing protein [Motiliproteus sp. SC1-56]